MNARVADSANALVRPPIAVLAAIAASLAANWLYPLPLVSAGAVLVWAGAAVFLLGFALAAWAISTFRAAGTRVETYRPTSTVVDYGPYRFTRNPIYTGMFLGLTGLALGFNTWWFIVALVIFFMIIRFGVVAREEVYLEHKFGETYLAYKSRVRRWL